MPRYEKEAKLVKNHSFNAINRLEFQSETRLDDPYKKLAAAVIIQAAIDKLRGEDETRYWYYGRLVRLENEMTTEDYRFYADIIGINYSWEDLFRVVKRRNPRISGKVVRDAAELFCK